MPLGATPSTVAAYRDHAERLALCAAGVEDPVAKAEFIAMAREWGRLAALAEWQVAAAAGL